MAVIIVSATADSAWAEVAPPTKPLVPLVQHVSAHPDGTAPNSIDFAALKGDRSALPIGVFDSGIGGLTVLEAILKLDAFNNATLQPGADGIPDFAGEKFIYLGDQANMPYGNYPSKGREDYLRELIVKDAVFLLGKRYHGVEGLLFDKPPVKAIVIACNTATAYGIEDIRTALKTWGLEIPVIGVVEAGARAVVEQLPSEGKAPTVGILATVGTCASNAYPKAIARAAGLAGKAVPLVVQQGSVGLAGAIEGNPAFVWQGAGERPVPYAGPQGPEAMKMLQLAGVASESPPATAPPDGADSFKLNSASAYALYDVAKLVWGAQQQIKGWTKEGGGALNMVVLGCTHFPLVETEFAGGLDYLKTTGTQKGIEQGVVSNEKTIFINPAEHTAKELFRELARAKLRNKAQAGEKSGPTAEFFLSVANPMVEGVKLAADGSFDTVYKEGRNAGDPGREDSKVVRMTPETLPGTSGELVKKLPAVWAQLRGPQEPTTSLRQRMNRMKVHGPNCQCPRHLAVSERTVSSGFVK